jgi:hypothetical protein
MAAGCKGKRLPDYGSYRNHTDQRTKEDFRGDKGTIEAERENPSLLGDDDFEIEHSKV